MAPATRRCRSMQQDASWCSEMSLAIKSCCCLMHPWHRRRSPSTSPGWFWGLGCPGDPHPNAPPCRSEGQPLGTLRKRCWHVGLKTQEINGMTARLGTLQELLGVDLSTRAVPSAETGDTSPTSPSCTPWIPRELGYLAGYQCSQGSISLSQMGFSRESSTPSSHHHPGGFTLLGCIPTTTPHCSRFSHRSHDATPMATARAPWPERAAGESCHAGSVPHSGTASPAAGWPAPPAPHCEFPSIFSPVINNSPGIRHQLPEQRGRGATRHPKQTEPLSQQLCPAEPSSRTFKYTLGPRGE